MLNITQPYNNTATNHVQSSFVRSLLERETARQDEYIKAREYYDGIHDTQLTDRTRSFLQIKNDVEFNVNYCPMVVNAKADRLKVTGFECEDETQSEQLWSWWRKNRMDRLQGIVHRSAIRDGDAYVLVEWDTVAQQPRFYFEPAYAGDGVMVYYSEERRDDIEFATKTWQIKYGSSTGKMVRKNIYLPDRIEKYYSHADVSTLWLPYEDETTTVMPGMLGNCGCNWWTDDGTEFGEPLGIPIVHFKFNDNGDCYGNSDLAKVMPVQDALNKAMIDLLGAMDTEGFGLLVGTGTDAWTQTKVGPGAIAAVNKPSSEADLKRLAGANPTGLLAVYNALVMEIARISGTPMSYFQTSGQVSAEGTMKQQEIALVTQIEKAQTDFGNSWEDCMILARRLYNVFGDGGMNEDEIIDTVWHDAETRNELELVQRLVQEVQALGVSEESAQTQLGYDADDIAKFKREKMRKQALALRQAASMATDPQAANQNMTQTENGANQDNAASNEAQAA